MENKNQKKIQVDTKKLYSYWKAMALSFYSPSLYWDVYKRWKGVGALYLLLMVSILSIPFGIKATIEAKHSLTRDILIPYSRIPDISYVDGKITFDKKMPFFIKNDKGEVETIIDNTGTVSIDDTENYPSLKFLFTDGHIYTIHSEADDPFFYLTHNKDSHVEDEEISKDTVLTLSGESLKDKRYKILFNVALMIIYPSIALTFSFTSLTILLILAMLGQLIGQLIFKVKLSFKQASRLLIVAYTPGFFFMQIIMMSNLGDMYIQYGCFALFFAYVLFALIAVKRNLLAVTKA